MNTKKTLAVFEGQKIRRHWDETKEKWYFSVIDIVQVLTGSTIPRRYWSDLKINLKQEGSEVYEKIVQLKIMAEDGKNRETDMADTETMFRIIQSIPSSKTEPFKLWLAQVGYERIEETDDVVRRGGKTAGIAREHLEKQLGRSVISQQNYLSGSQSQRKMIK